MKSFKYLATFSSKPSIKPTYLQRKYVHHTYDIIAQHFDLTRFAAWPKVKRFVDTLEEGSIVYDIGCGNGKYFNKHKTFMLGCDLSLNILKYASKRNPDVQFMAANVLKLPIRSQSCDAFICIAVLHHLSTQQTRKMALCELGRILVEKGRGLIYVWCLQQTISHTEAIPKQQMEPGHQKEQDIFVKWHLQPQLAQSSTDKQTFQFSKQKNAYIVKRYCHLYRKGQLQTLLQSVPKLKIIDSYYDKDNWCCEVEKL